VLLIVEEEENLVETLIYLLTPWSSVLLDKLTGLQLVKKFPSFYGTRRFITAFTSRNTRRRKILCLALPINKALLYN
jgi:hypothetical protein